MQQKTFTQLIQEHGEWCQTTFPKATAGGALTHAMRECKEAVDDLILEQKGAVMEVADFIGCVLDAGRRHGLDMELIGAMLDLLCHRNCTFTLSDVRAAFQEKLEINKDRTWKDNGDGSYSHVKKVIPPPDSSWLDVAAHTPEWRREYGQVLPVRVRYEDGTEDICGWNGADYYTNEDAKPITHFKFIDHD